MKDLNNNLGIFPFGEKVKPVVQKDRSAKKVFILGVYASAVHARWFSHEGKQKAAALAVASEPEIFWRGDNADSIISKISIPEGLGKLVTAGDRFNGPSGKSLDEKYLDPLGLTRESVWLCDIYPFAHMNKGQRQAIDREYLPIAKDCNLPIPTLNPAPTTKPDKDRVDLIWSELEESEAEILVLLGDKPIQWFLNFFDKTYRRLSDFGKSIDEYGQIHFMKIEGREIGLLPLVHPRQASSLGRSSLNWFELHKRWTEERAKELI